MHVDRIENLNRIPLAIDYRRLYRGSAYLQVGPLEPEPINVEFVLELDPFGTHQISVKFLSPAPYPTVPAIRALKDHIAELEKSGHLP